MAAKKKRKRRNKPWQSFLVSFAVTCLLIYLIAAALSGCVKISALNKEIAAANNTLSQIKDGNKDTKELIDSADQNDIVERIAREKLGYVMPDEKIFHDAG